VTSMASNKIGQMRGLALWRNSSAKQSPREADRLQWNKLIEWSALSLLQMPLDLFRRPVRVSFDYAYSGPVSLVHKSV
jgi:hypothetical protein